MIFRTRNWSQGSKLIEIAYPPYTFNVKVPTNKMEYEKFVRRRACSSVPPLDNFKANIPALTDFKTRNPIWYTFIYASTGTCFVRAGHVYSRICLLQKRFCSNRTSTPSSCVSIFCRRPFTASTATSQSVQHNGARRTCRS